MVGGGGGGDGGDGGGRWFPAITAVMIVCCGGCGCCWAVTKTIFFKIFLLIVYIGRAQKGFQPDSNQKNSL